MLTNCVFILGNFHYAGKSKSSSEGIWVAWKWHNTLAPFALLLEFIITAYFWLVLNGPGNDLRIGGILDHSVPFTLLLIDYVCFHSYKIIKNQIFIVITFMFSYLLTNLIVKKITGFDVYGGMDWETPTGIILPLGVALIAFVFWALLV